MKKIPTDSFQFKIVKLNGVKTIQLLSRPYYQHWINEKTKEGDIGSMELTLKKPTRSEAQLRYYAVIVGLIAGHSGYTWNECHEGLMIARWGTKKIKIGNKEVFVRKSVSDSARMKKVDMMDQIEYTLSVAKDYEIKIPTREELGYLEN